MTIGDLVKARDNTPLTNVNSIPVFVIDVAGEVYEPCDCEIVKLPTGEHQFIIYAR